MIIYLSIRRGSIAMASLKQQLHFQNLNKTTGNVPRPVPECAHSLFLLSPPNQKRTIPKGHFTFQPFIFRDIIVMGVVPNSDFQHENTTAVGSGENKFMRHAGRNASKTPHEAADGHGHVESQPHLENGSINSFTTSWLHTKYTSWFTASNGKWALNEDLFPIEH